MNNWGSNGITGMIILIAIMLITVTVAGVVTDETTSTTTEEDYEQMLEDAVNEISRYILVKEILGKFSNINGERQIEKIFLWITPLFEQYIDLSQLTIELNNRESVMMLTYSGISNPMESGDVFEQSIWDSLNGTNFGLISIIDLDDSIVNNAALDKAGDHVGVVLKLPNGMTMSKYDEMVLKLVLPVGVVRTLYLKVPFSTKSIVPLD